MFVALKRLVDIEIGGAARFGIGEDLLVFGVVAVEYGGEVYIDDVWGEGSKSGISPVTGKKYPLLSDAIKAGLYHPRCRDSHTAYIEGITKAEPVYTRKELQQAQRAEAEEQRQQYIKRQAKSWQRQADYALDAENKAEAQARADDWKQRI